MKKKNAPIHSMTGFATVQSAVEDDLAFTLTLKSVNHRFLDLSLRLPGDCDALEAALRRLIKECVKRGHVDVTLHLDRRAREQTQTIQLNRELLAAHVQVFHEAAKLHHFNVEPNLNEILKMPGVLSPEAATAAPDATRSAALEAAVMALVPTLLEQLNHVRAVEGATRYNRGRMDVYEELVRLRTHIESFVEMLDAGGELGKRLDFLLQELNREANTMLSKTTGGDPGIGLRLTTLGLEMKSEIERAREQVQNLE